MAAIEITVVFATFAGSVEQRDGEIAAAMASTGAIERLYAYGAAAIHNNRAELGEFDPFDQFLVLLIREAIPHDELGEMNAVELLAFLIDRGWFFPENYRDREVGEIQYFESNGEVFALGQLVEYGFPTKLQKLRFALEEDGRWYYDFWPLVDHIGSIWNAAVTAYDGPLDRWMVQALTEKLGHPPSDQLWIPHADR